MVSVSITNFYLLAGNTELTNAEFMNKEQFYTHIHSAFKQIVWACVCVCVCVCVCGVCEQTRDFVHGLLITTFLRFIFVCGFCFVNFAFFMAILNPKPYL